MVFRHSWKTVQHFFQNLKIRPKIQLFGTALTVLLCLIFLSFYSSVASRATIERATRNAEENLTRIQLYFQHLNTEIAGRLSHLDTSISLRQMLEDRGGAQDAGTAWSVDGLLKDIQSLACLKRVEIYTLDGACLAASCTAEEPGGLKPEVRAAVCASPAANLWRDDSDTRNGRTDGISVYRAVVSQETGMPIGVVRAVLDGAALADIYNYVGFNLSSELYIFSMSGNLLLPKETTPSVLRVGRDSFETYLGRGDGAGRYWFQNEAYCTQSLPLPDYGIYTVSIAPYSSLIQDIRLLQMTILSLGALCAAAELVFFFFMGRSVSQPIVVLTRQVECIRAGNLSLRIPNSGQSDEIGILADSINSMLNRIEALMQEVAEAEQQKRKLELRSLQTQITPHFLYNSLDNLSALAQIGDMEGAYGMAHALGEFYRSVLSDGRSIICLREELDIVDSYLRVQSQRYRDRFDYQIDIPSELEQIQIVKLTIQPLVENAIYHGIRNVRRMGHIHITGRLEREEVVLSVEDNGKGFPQEPDCPEQPGEKGDLIFHRKGFGMLNADQRIKLYFGPNYGVHVRSERNVGACVEIHLPRKPYEEAQDDFGFNRR